jgi:aryl carrier-like protein
MPDDSRLEERLALIWRDVLDSPDMGLDDNFFDHGAQSILLIKAHHRLVRELGRQIAVVSLFRYPTVRSLARFLSAGEEDDASGDLLAERRKAGRQRLDTRRSLRRADMNSSGQNLDA